MKHNPYTMIFGKEPSQSITRLMQTDEIITQFLSEPPAQQIYMITGVRGSGKTVFLTEIAKKIGAEKNWIVTECNAAKDLLTGLASGLYHDNRLTSYFKSAKINLSVFGIGIEISRAEPITDIEIAVRRMLETVRDKKKKVLVTIDEVTNTKQMREFASAFQIMVRQDLPIFLLMTGLYENIDVLQNNKAMTFLHRAPKIHLKPLNIGSIASNYRKVLSVNEADALQMARMTRGYPFAFQVLGYYTFEHNGHYEEALPLCKQYLEEYAYDKIWSELSRLDKRILKALAASKTGSVSEIREDLGMTPNQFGSYRNRLLKRGLVNGDEYGYLSLSLPFFESYIETHQT
ncbi:MAG: AAA family ATPase [Lachnospiraceae bacterium]|nr:AAA family ATPase [Lachnospiraceae bacterium]